MVYPSLFNRLYALLNDSELKKFDMVCPPLQFNSLGGVALGRHSDLATDDGIFRATCYLDPVIAGRHLELFAGPEDVLLETDAPFLAPQPVRGKRNEPVHSLYTLQALATLYGLETDVLGRITTQNARALFRLNSTPDATP